MASLSCPDCGVKVQPEDLICFRCGANLPHAAEPEEDLLTPTISQRFIAAGSEPGAFCPSCGAPVSDAADVVCSTCGDPLPTGRRRRIYRLTRTGKRELGIRRQRWREFASTVEAVLA